MKYNKFVSKDFLITFIDGKHCRTRKFKDITLGDGFYTSVMVDSVMDCEHHCLMNGSMCDYVEIKHGEVGILCLLFHSKDIMLEEQEDATVLQKICPKGMILSFIRSITMDLVESLVWT